MTYIRSVQPGLVGKLWFALYYFVGHKRIKNVIWSLHSQTEFLDCLVQNLALLKPISSVDFPHKKVSSSLFSVIIGIKVGQHETEPLKISKIKEIQNFKNLISKKSLHFFAKLNANKTHCKNLDHQKNLYSTLFEHKNTVNCSVAPMQNKASYLC